MVQAPQAAPQLDTAIQTQVNLGLTVESANIDALVPQLTLIVPEENTEPGRAEIKSILEEACEHVKSMSIDLTKDIFKDAAKDAAKVVLVGWPLLAFAQFLKRRAGETGNKSIAWLGEAAEKIAELFGKHPIVNVVTTEELTATFGNKALATETLLLTLGYKKRGNQWSRA